MKLKSKKFTRPVVTPFEEEVDPVGLARTVAKEYRAMEDGHHAQLRAFLGRAYHVYRLFQQAPSSYEELKHHLPTPDHLSPPRREGLRLCRRGTGAVRSAARLLVDRP